MMRALAVMVSILVGCKSDPAPSAAGAASPEAAARCLHAGIKAKSVSATSACWHPKLQAEVRTELEEDAAEPGYWDDSLRRAAALEALTASDFKIGPIQANRKAWGDQMAEYRMPDDRDSFHAVRDQGRWFVADSGF
jgi:hypothetical protein